MRQKCTEKSGGFNPPEKEERIQDIRRGESGDAVPQKTWCPPLVLLRTPTAKERFCRNTYAKAGKRAGRENRVVDSL